MSFFGSYGYLDLSTRFVLLIQYDPINVEIRINIEEYSSPDELSVEEQQLIERAIHPHSPLKMMAVTAAYQDKLLDQFGF